MNETTEKYIMYGLIAVGVLILLFSFLPFLISSPSSPAVPSAGSSSGRSVVAGTFTGTSFESLTTGTTENGDVAISMTPSPVTDGVLKVALGVNTHSVDLSPFNLQQLMTLTYGGKEVKPSLVPTLSGHHTSGEVVFKVPSALTQFTITLDGIPAVSERVYTWK